MFKTSRAVIPNLFRNLTNGKTLKQVQGDSFKEYYCNIVYSHLNNYPFVLVFITLLILFIINVFVRIIFVILTFGYVNWRENEKKYNYNFGNSFCFDTCQDDIFKYQQIKFCKTKKVYGCTFSYCRYCQISISQKRV